MQTMVTNGVSFSLVAGTLIAVNFTSGGAAYYTANGSTVTWGTLNVNSTGSKPIKAWDRYANQGNEFKPESGVHNFVYDGTNWCMVTFHMYR